MSKLARVVPRLAPQTLHQLIRHRGLDSCGELVAAATPQQVAAILDLDLWRPAAAGGDDRFDAERFGEWIEALMNEGEDVAARIVAAMDPSLAVVGLSRFVRVFDVGVFEPAASSDDESPDSSRAAHLEVEVGGCVVRARTTDAWDAIVGLLVTLAVEHTNAFHELMQGCRRVSNSTPEIDGLDDLLMAPDQLLHDVSIEREHRRTQQGYLTAGDARAFLQMARQGSSSINPVASAYFRALDDAASAPMSSDAPIDLVGAEATTSARPRTLLGAGAADLSRVTPIQPLLEFVHDTHPVEYFARTRELALLANALVAGCAVYSRPFTIQESWSAAIGTCNLGLEAADRTTTLPAAFLVDHDLVTAFEAGWRLLHEDVSMFVAHRLIAALENLRSIDVAVERDLDRLRRSLQRHRDAGTPWLAQESLEVIAILDTPVWACLCGLLSECPVLPAALGAILDGHTHSVSATAFECISTDAQIRRVHAFVERLPDLLLQ